MIQKILDKVKNGADEVIFKLKWSSFGEHNNPPRGVFYLRAQDKEDRDDWIKHITQCLLMAETHSQTFADFRRMRIGTVGSNRRESRGSRVNSNDQSASLARAREIYRLQQQYLHKVDYGRSSSVDESDDWRYSEASQRSQRSQRLESESDASAIFQECASIESSITFTARKTVSFKDHDVCISDDGYDSYTSCEEGDLDSDNDNDNYNDDDDEYMGCSAEVSPQETTEGDELPIRRTSDPRKPRRQSKKNWVSSHSKSANLTQEEKDLLKIFCSDEERDEAVDARHSVGKKGQGALGCSFMYISGEHLYLLGGRKKVKIDSFIRLFRVCATYPFVLIFGVLNLHENRFLKRHFKGWFTFCVMANATIYFLPYVVVEMLLKRNSYQFLTTMLTGGYLALYLLPVCLVVFYKIKKMRETNKIVDGTFHYLPKHTLRFTCPNVCNMYGLVMEFVILATYCLPAEVLGGQKKGGTVERLTGIPYEYVFWVVVLACFFNAGAFVMHPVLRGRYKYRYQENHAFWQVIHFINGPLYITVVTFLFQALSCDFQDPNRPVLIEQKTMVCFENPSHVKMSMAAMVALALYLTQSTLVPTLTYKETMFNKQLDVLYVPVYLQGHWILKAVYASVYVTFYGYSEFTRVCFLLMINICMLVLQVYVRPCSIRSVNIMRTASFTSATWAALASTLYVGIGGQCESFAFLLLVMISGWCMIFGGAFLFFRATQRPLEAEVDHTFLELERQAQTGEVQPRVMEPFIAMTMEVHHNPHILDECKLAIPQLIWLVDYPNVRIQYQSLWALANLAHHEDCRREIFLSRSRMDVTGNSDESGIEVILRLFTSAKSQPALKMEALAALINCSVSTEVARFLTSELKVLKTLVELLWRQTMYTQFVTMAIGNLAKDRCSCQELCQIGAVQALMGLVLTPNFLKQKFACMALANIAQNMPRECVGPLVSEDFMDRIVKLATTNDTDMHEEISTLLRNLSFYPALARMMRDRGAIVAVAYMRKSTNEKVKEAGKIAARNLMGEGSEDQMEEAAHLKVLSSFEPLEAIVSWDTWTSKLESVFSPVFAAAPQAIGRHVVTITGAERKILLKGEDSLGRALTFKIKHEPRHGRLGKIKDDGSICYKPDEGFAGEDYFTYVARNVYMESNIATVAIKVRSGQELKRAAEAIDAMIQGGDGAADGSGLMQSALFSLGEALTRQVLEAKAMTGKYFFGGGTEAGNDEGGRGGDGDVGGSSKHAATGSQDRKDASSVWSGGVNMLYSMFSAPPPPPAPTQAATRGQLLPASTAPCAKTKYDQMKCMHQLTGSDKFTITRAEIRNAGRKREEQGENK